MLARLSSLAASARRFMCACARLRPGNAARLRRGFTERNKRLDAEGDECFCRGSFDLSACIKCWSPHRADAPSGCSGSCVLVCTHALEAQVPPTKSALSSREMNRLDFERVADLSK